MSDKTQQKHMEDIYRLISQDLSYIFGEKESGPNGAKKVFLTKSAAFLRALAHDLNFTESKVNTNPSGIAVSGEVSLYGMWSEGNGLFFEITQPCSYPHAFLYRHISGMKDHRGGPNHWLSCSVFKEQDYLSLVSALAELRKQPEVKKNAA